MEENCALTYLDSGLLMSREELNLILDGMCNTNREHILNAKNVLWETDLAKFVSKFCENLKLHKSITCQALQIFFKYISAEFEMFGKFSDLNRRRVAQRNFEKQTKLYVVVCVAMATKLRTRQSYLNLCDVVHLLRVHGVSTTYSTIHKCERRITLLEPDIFSETPYFYISCLLLFVMIDFPNLDFCGPLEQKSVMLLDCMYVHKVEVYHNLFVQLEQNGICTSPKLKSDYMMFACGCILAALHLWDCDGVNGKNMCNYFQHLLKVPKYVLESFTHSIIQTYRQLHSEHHPLENVH